MPFSKIEGLTDLQKTEIAKSHDDIVSKLTRDRDDLLAEKSKMGQDTKDRAEKAESDKIQNASSLAEMKQLLADRDKKASALEQRILDDEKSRLEDKQSQVVNSFVDKFVNEHVVNDSLVRDAIKSKISSRLGVRGDNIVELNGSELTGKTGAQVLDEIRTDKGYSTHLIANNASGGGALGGAGNRVGVTKKTMSRDQFESMPPAEVAEFVRGGGTFVDQT